MSITLFCENCGAALVETMACCPACGTAVSAPGPSIQRATSPPAGSAATGSATVAPFSPCQLPAGFLLARRYCIVSQLGRGGFATVYKARDRAQRNRLVAIKQIHLETLNLQEMLDASDAYNREVNYLSQMRYKHLPQMYAHFMDEQHWYIVMEYIDGQTLEEYVQKNRRRALPVKQVLEIGLDLCATLQYLHMQRPPLIFRDLKPANIIRTRSGKLYLIDFGTTRPYRPGWKDTGPLGTPGYAAPEQYGSRAHTTPQTDIYGLGATLQTLLTGQEPLDILQHGLSPDQARRLPSALLDMLAKMQRREAIRRPRDMGEVRRALQEIQAQFLSQKLKAAVLMGHEALKETPFFATLSLTLLFFIDLASFTGMIWPGIWLLSLLAMSVFTCLKGHSRLREARDESQGRLNTDEKVTILWKQFASSWSFALFIAFFAYYLSAFLAFFQSADGNSTGADWVSSGVVVGACLLVCLGWIGRQIWQLQMRRRQVKQQQRQMLIQQTMLRRP